MRIPSSYLDFVASRPTLDLSHNESARLAADCLLTQGLEGYHEVLQAEGEVDFLSELEKNYILENGKDSSSDPDACDGSDNGFESLSTSFHSATERPSGSKDSDPTEADVSSNEGANCSPDLDGPNVEVFFHTENRAAGLKDMVREFIRKAEKSLAIVIDHFSDVELLCDLLEASKKRNVTVHLLLDHFNLKIFTNMWQELKLQGKDFPKFSVHSVDGQTYCAKTGRKLSGQISECFIITDWFEVLTGSYSFSWLSWLVHRSLVFLVKGSAVTHFHQEFYRLYSSSKPVPGFNKVPYTILLEGSLHAEKHEPKCVGKIRSDQTDMARIWDWIEDALNSHTKERTKVDIPQMYLKPVGQQRVMKEKHTLGGVSIQDNSKIKKNTTFQNYRLSYTQSQQNSHNFTSTGKSGDVHGAACLHSAMLTHRQDMTFSSTLKKDFTRHVSTEDYWTQRQNKNTMRPPGIVGPTFELQMKALSKGSKTQDQSPRHHFLQSQTTMRSPTSIGTYPKPQPDSKLFLAGTRNKLSLEPNTSQQVKPSPRLLWMPQSNTARSRPVVGQRSFSAAFDTVQRRDAQLGWRQFHSTTAKSLARSQSMTDRPTTRLNSNITKN